MCECRSCRLSRRIARLKAGMSSAQRGLIDYLYERMADAEQDREVAGAKLAGEWPAIAVVAKPKVRREVFVHGSIPKGHVLVTVQDCNMRVKSRYLHGVKSKK